jgi:excisionase family DNA binding protein
MRARSRPSSLRHGEVSAFGPLGSGRKRNQITFFTIAEIAECLRVTDRTIRRWIEAGDLPVHRIGGIVRIAENDLRGFLALHREG